jgi:hypothetical protein
LQNTASPRKESDREHTLLREKFPRVAQSVILDLSCKFNLAALILSAHHSHDQG